MKKNFFLIILLTISLIPCKSLAEETPPTDAPAELVAETSPPETTVSSTTAIIDEIAIVDQPTTTSTPIIETTSTPIIETTTTEIIVPSSTPATVNLHIRYNDNLFFDAPVELTSSTITVNDSSNVQHTIPAYSALGVITQADTASDAFAISNLGYFASFNSFLINCITIQNVTEPACYNWQYVVNDTYPFVGAESFLLQPNDDVYWYFGNQHRITLPVSTTEAHQPVMAKAEVYHYKTNAYAPLPGMTVGATQPDPNNPWSPIVVTSTLSDALGQANLVLTATGTYYVGIAEDYYFPTVPLTVTEAIVTPTATTTTSTDTTNTTTSSESSSGGGGGSTNTSKNATPAKNFDVNQAITFLGTQQNATTGAIGSGSFYSDWSAIAFGSYAQNSPAKDLLITYLKTDPNPGSSTTDLERRTMALMALGINPYSGTKTDYITSIMGSYQDNQFGEIELVNDDIFALFPLLKAGYTSGDAEIKNAVKFIVARQSPTGAWESPDLTAAGIQALSQVKDLPGVTAALAKAELYLKANVKSDGRIDDNAFSTSWAQQAISALGQNEADWKLTSGATPSEYLASRQNADGGMEEATSSVNDRVWSTAYAIPAIMHKSWPATLVSFAKPVVQPVIQAPTDNSTIGTSVSTDPIVVTPTSTVTTTLPTATSTPSLATSTPNILTTSTPILITAPIITVTPPTENISTVQPVVIADETPSRINNLPRAKKITLASAPATPETTPVNSNTMIAPTGTTQPISTTAKGVFGGAAAVAGSLGAYLAWRFIQGLV